MVKVTGAFQKSSEIMKTTNQLVKLPQLSATMREMSMEMTKVSCLLIPRLIMGVTDRSVVRDHVGDDGGDTGRHRRRRD